MLYLFLAKFGLVLDGDEGVDLEEDAGLAVAPVDPVEGQLGGSATRRLGTRARGRCPLRRRRRYLGGRHLGHLRCSSSSSSSSFLLLLDFRVHQRLCSKLFKPLFKVYRVGIFLISPRQNKKRVLHRAHRAPYIKLH